MAVVVPVGVLLIVGGVVGYCIWKKKRANAGGSKPAEKPNKSPEPKPNDKKKDPTTDRSEIYK